MVDSFGRVIDYMRISITDRCNLRCRYCMPDGIERVSMKEILSYEEILQVVTCAAELGIQKIKITGGEPLVRKGCCSLIGQIKAIPGICQVTLTTNGTLLGDYIDELTEAGIDGINISLDTVDSYEFAEITGFDKLDAVLHNIWLAKEKGIPIKLNVVNLPGMSYMDMLEYSKTVDCDIRFIEVMPIGAGGTIRCNSNEKLMKEIARTYGPFVLDERIHGNGPAVYYRLQNEKRAIGFISAVHGPFCDCCNRIRLSSQGLLKACLCYEAGVNLKSILRADESEEQKHQLLSRAIETAIRQKPKAHCFDSPARITEKSFMASIGG